MDQPRASRGIGQKELAERPQLEFGPPSDGADIVFVRVDADTGKLAGPGARNAFVAPFVRGMEPTEVEPGRATSIHAA